MILGLGGDDTRPQWVILGLGWSTSWEEMGYLAQLVAPAGGPANGPTGDSMEDGLWVY